MSNNKNAVVNWSYTKPTEPGLYFVNDGDVETENAYFFRLIERDGVLMDASDGFGLYQYGPSYKFARLVIGAEAQEMEG